MALSGTELEAKACFLGERIDVRGLEGLAERPLLIEVGDGRAAVFRYGAVVGFGIPPARLDALCAELAARVTKPYETPEQESITIRIDPEGQEDVVGHCLTLHDGSERRLQVVAEVLAKSVVLAQYESEVASAFHLVEPLAEQLEQGIGGRRVRDLLVHIGRMLRIQHRMVGRVEVTEKPELLWEHAEFERLYARLAHEYELRERHAALERKLELIGTTASTALELLHNRRSLRVEWYIVLLIVVEIVLTLVYV